MSLKGFHFVFMSLSVSLVAIFGIWCFQQYGNSDQSGYLVTGLVSFILIPFLILYLNWFLKKLKGVGMFSLLIGLCGVPSIAEACPVCLGDPNSPLAKATASGVWFLLAVVGILLAGFLTVFCCWAYRSRKLQIPKTF